MMHDRCLEREKESDKQGRLTLLINIFFLVFYVNIQTSCSKTKMEYFNIKIRLLFRKT